MKAFINGLSIFRIGAAFALVPLMFEQLWGAALILFSLAAASDFFDGWLARKFKATSKLGGVLDHMGDKFLMTIGMVIAMLAVQTPLVISLVITMIIRDLYISGLREFMGSQKMELPVDNLGKIKTAAQLVALFAFFGFFYIYMNDISIGAHSAALYAALGLLALAAALSVLSAARYTLKAVQKIKKGK
ncbi:MAG: CDP-alcohol phosphatidyltransferase family protein [Rickettsiales bacterium]|jgi:CDP-diacylglycerol--glycerol-3-phosphate 3-phosphatidyltransferase|nr:CDP-alcohol phosphatidyltransferase family protein [Rickettsiales bacterium]